MTDNLILFIAAGLLLNLTPGPDVVYIVTNALKAGFRAGAVAAFGIVAGCFVHILGAAIGLGALIAASATLFTVLKYLGAAYLVYLGCRMLMSARPAGLGEAEAPGRTLAEIFWRGFATNALNPKVALFFLAFVPQFIAPDAGSKVMAFILLGLVFNFNSIFVNLGWAAAAASLAANAAPVRNAMHWIERGAGLLFIGFGIRLATASLAKA